MRETNPCQFMLEVVPTWHDECSTCLDIAFQIHLYMLTY